MVKKMFTIIVQILVLFLFSLMGTWIQQFLNLSIPGSVFGLILLFILLSFNIIPEKWIAQGASFMTRHLILFFIPATVGIMNYYQLFVGKGLLVIIITVISSLMVLVITGFTSEKLAAQRRSENV